jgi:hypothetical protein
VSVAFADALGETATVSVSEDLLQRVTAAMPPQPWPDGTATIVARQIGVSKNTMALAVKELMRRGVFKVQVDGQLYAPISMPAAGSI